jgi:hypothetical protein
MVGATVLEAHQDVHIPHITECHSRSTLRTRHSFSAAPDNNASELKPLRTADFA